MFGSSLLMRARKWFRKSWSNGFEGTAWRPWGEPWFKPRPEPTPQELVDLYRDTAYYCANLNARAVARVPLRLFVRTRVGEPTPKCLTEKIGKRLQNKIRNEARPGRRLSTDETIDEVMDHPILDLLAEPSRLNDVPVLSRFELLELTQLSLDILGRAYWLIVTNGLGMPAGLWPLAAQHVRPVFSSDGSSVPDYEWTAERVPRRLQAKELIVFHTPDLREPITGGVSPARASFARIGLTEMYVQHQQAMLDNRARPDVVISPSQPEGYLGDAEAKRLESAFQRRFRGGGAGGVFVSKDSIRVDPLRFPNRDLGELSESQASLEQIARAFDIPLSMLNRDANRASAEQGRAQHASDAVAPRLARIADRLNQRLVPLFDPSGRLFLRFDDPVKESIELKLRTRSLNLRLGFTTINEERAEEGYAPVPWGNEPMTDAYQRE